jgi:hypothetical protein
MPMKTDIQKKKIRERGKYKINDWQINLKKKFYVCVLCYCPHYVEFRGYKKVKQSLYRPEQTLRVPGI